MLVRHEVDVVGWQQEPAGYYRSNNSGHWSPRSSRYKLSSSKHHDNSYNTSIASGAYGLSVAHYDLLYAIL